MSAANAYNQYIYEALLEAGAQEAARRFKGTLSARSAFKEMPQDELQYLCMNSTEIMKLVYQTATSVTAKPTHGVCFQPRHQEIYNMIENPTDAAILVNAPATAEIYTAPLQSMTPTTQNLITSHLMSSEFV